MLARTLPVSLVDKLLWEKLQLANLQKRNSTNFLKLQPQAPMLARASYKVTFTVYVSA